MRFFIITNKSGLYFRSDDKNKNRRARLNLPAFGEGAGKRRILTGQFSVNRRFFRVDLMHRFLFLIIGNTILDKTVFIVVF